VAGRRQAARRHKLRGSLDTALSPVVRSAAGRTHEGRDLDRAARSAGPDHLKWYKVKESAAKQTYTEGERHSHATRQRSCPTPAGNWVAVK